MRDKYGECGRLTAAFCIAAILVLGSCVKPKPTGTDGKAIAENEKGIGRSPNWKLEVVSTSNRVIIHLGQSLGTLSVKLKIQYLGPSGAVKAPVTKVTYQSSENKEEVAYLRGYTAHFSAKAESLDFGKWVVETNVEDRATSGTSSAASTKQLETGKEFEITFDYDYQPYKPSAPLPSAKFWLEFADVPRVESIITYPTSR